MPNPSMIQRDDDGIPMRAGAVFETDSRRERMRAVECQSPVTHAGIFQHQHVHLVSEVARLTGECARLRSQIDGLEIDNRLLRTANIALMDREERVMSRNADLEAAIRQVIAGHDREAAIAALPDH